MEGRATSQLDDPGADPLEVLLVTPYSLNANPYVRLLADSLEDRGVRVRLATGRSPILLWRALRSGGVPDIVHVQWHHRYFTSTTRTRAVFRTAFFFLQWLLLRLLGARFVWTIHNLLAHERRQARWELFACRRWARRVDALIAHCPEAVGLVAGTYRIPADRVRVVPHGRFPETRPQPSRAEAREELDLPAGPRIFLFFGRVRPYKGLEMLLDTFAALPDDARLLLVGHPSTEDLGQRLAARAAGDPRVRLDLRFVSPETLDLYVAACDAVVLPYTDLLTSGAAILAASRARPVIVPALACLRSLPPDRAILYDPADPGGLGAALRQAIDAPLDAMGRAAREHTDALTWDRVAAETVAVYRSAGVPGGRRLVPGGRRS